MSNKKCKHEYKLSHTAWEQPYGGSYAYNGTQYAGQQKQYAYLVCQKCWNVKKVEVEQTKPDSYHIVDISKMIESC